METLTIEAAFSLMTGVFTVLWWLLRTKDSKQAKEIEALWKKHDEDAKELQGLRLEIAKEHYLKRELDAKFDKLDTTFREVGDKLGSKLDVFIGKFVDHVNKDHGDRSQ